ncbi:Adaptive-response sensory-kinase SasA [Firmicutes bacterium ASF500]|nr:Adaptive-response sensory-kinase SasA [Firmicutes bacterium ASF500]
MTLKKRMAVFLAAGAAALTAILFMSRFDNKYTMSGPLTQDGALVISASVLEEGPVWAPYGWELFPGILLEPGSEAAGLPVYVGQVQTWAVFHEDSSPYGQASFRLMLEGPEEPETVSLWLPEVFSACRVYVNGALAGRSGELSPNYRPLARDLTVSFPLSGRTEVVIQAENWSHYYSGMTYPPAVGTPQAVAELTAGRTALYALMTFSALAVALYSLAAWQGRDMGEQTHLWLAGMTLSFALRISYPLRLLHGVRLIGLTYALEDGAAMAGIWCALGLALELGRMEGPWAKGVRRLAFAMIPLAAAVPVWVLPQVPALTPAYGIWMSLWRLASALALVAAALRGGLLARTAWPAAGTAVYAVSLFWSVVSINRFEPARGAWPDEWGGYVLVLCFSALMVSRSLAMSRENRRLNERLQEEVERQTGQIAGLVGERQELLSEFLHDLKSPLSSLISYARLVRENDVLLDGRTRIQLEVILGKSEEMARQLRMMQQFNSDNPIASQWERLDLTRFTAAFYQKFQPDVEVSGPDFRLELPQEPCMVRADPEKLSRALQNLLFNAVSFTPEEGEIVLRLRKEGAYARLSVRDTGPGLDPAVQDQVFQRGVTTRGGEGGEGLGLFIVQSVAREHGGRAEVRSRRGKGAEFSILLPTL